MNVIIQYGPIFISSAALVVSIWKPLKNLINTRILRGNIIGIIGGGITTNFVDNLRNEYVDRTGWRYIISFKFNCFHQDLTVQECGVNIKFKDDPEWKVARLFFYDNSIEKHKKNILGLNYLQTDVFYTKEAHVLYETDEEFDEVANIDNIDRIKFIFYDFDNEVTTLTLAMNSFNLNYVDKEFYRSYEG